MVRSRTMWNVFLDEVRFLESDISHIGRNGASKVGTSLKQDEEIRFDIV